MSAAKDAGVLAELMRQAGEEGAALAWWKARMRDGATVTAMLQRGPR